MDKLRPLPFKQLTRLQVQKSHHTASDVLNMMWDLPQLEVLEVLNTRYPRFELLDFDVTALSRLPKLRLVDLLGSKLWVDMAFPEAAVRGENMQNGLPMQVAQHMMCLQRARPGVEWVLGSNNGQ